MAQYTVKYACGHEGTINLFGSRRDRERALWGYERSLCPECERKAWSEANAEAAKKNAELGLPALTGSVKQVEWAELIRYRAYTQLSDVINDWGFNDPQMRELKPDRVQAATMAFNQFFSHDSARFFIDNRDREYLLFREMMSQCVRDMKSGKTAHQPTERLFVSEDGADDTAVLTVSRDTVRISSAYNEHLIKIVKGHGFSWNPSGRVWERRSDAGVPSAVDLAAEMINALVSAGIAVSTTEEDVIALVDSGTWTPENTRIVCFAPKYNAFQMPTERNTDDYCKLAMSLPRAVRRYVKALKQYCVTVPGGSYEAVLDFAETTGAVLSPEAAEYIEGRTAVERTAVTPREIQAPDAVTTADLRHEEDLSDLVDN